MKKKEFKAESRRLLDLMINSIYTNKDIFLRELISNASDAIDKLNYKSLTNSDINVNKDDFKIKISVNKDLRCISILDNGIGMDKDELENNLGTICESGSFLFKKENEKLENIDVIGQFGVGFYSAFMVASKIDVISKKYSNDDAYIWSCDGLDGYTIESAKKDDYGTLINIYLKDDKEYDEYLDEYKLSSIIKKYSNYITYPIVISMPHVEEKDENSKDGKTVYKDEVINSMIPIWKKSTNEISKEDYNHFYTDTYYDYEKPLKYFRNRVEGNVSYTSLLFIPSHSPYDFYQKSYEKGLQLYSNGVLIMDKCADLLPDYFNFVRGLVDSEDVSLNISREILQQDKQIKTIAKSIESKIKKELLNMLNNDRDNYVKFFKNFGNQIKFGIYDDFGLHKDDLKDLVMFYSYKMEKLVTLKEYVDNMTSEQDAIYYAAGESYDKINNLPQMEYFKDKNFDVLYFTDYIDEFAIQVLSEYEGKKFKSINSLDTDISSDKDKEKLDKENNDNKDLLGLIKTALKDDVSDVLFTNKLSKHPVALLNKGNISSNMEKIINAMPSNQDVKADKVLEINVNHPIADKLKSLYKDNKDMLNDYAKVLYAQALLMDGMSIDNPSEICDIVLDYLSK